MNKIKPGREVMVVGVGLHPFGRFPDEDLGDLAIGAVLPALKDAGVKWKDIAIAYFGHVYYQGMSVGETTLSKLGLTGSSTSRTPAPAAPRPSGRPIGASPPDSMTWPLLLEQKRCRAAR